MKKWKMQFTPEAALLLSKLHPENKRRIKKELEKLKQNPYPGKDLQEELSGFKSFRLKQYLIVYNINEDEKIIQIFYIGQRSDVYEQFRRLLTELKNSVSTV